MPWVLHRGPQTEEEEGEGFAVCPSIYVHLSILGIWVLGQLGIPTGAPDVFEWDPPQVISGTALNSHRLLLHLTLRLLLLCLLLLHLLLDR